MACGGELAAVADRGKGRRRPTKARHLSLRLMFERWVSMGPQTGSRLIMMYRSSSLPYLRRGLVVAGDATDEASGEAA